MKVSVPFPLLNNSFLMSVVLLQFHTGVHGYQIWYTICLDIKNARTINASVQLTSEIYKLLSTANIVINFECGAIFPNYFLFQIKERATLHVLPSLLCAPIR